MNYFKAWCKFDTPKMIYGTDSSRSLIHYAKDLSFNWSWEISKLAKSGANFEHVVNKVMQCGRDYEWSSI